MTVKNYIVPLCRVFSFSAESGLLSESFGGSSQPFGPYVEGGDISGLGNEDFEPCN